MAIRWNDFKQRVLRVLDDLDRDNPSWSDDDLLDYANDALTTISQHTAQEKTVEVELEADTETYALPDDYMDPGPVWLTNGTTRTLLQPLRLQPGQDLPTGSSTVQRTRYYEWPVGTLNFLRTVAAGTTLKVFYFGYWDRVTDDHSLLPIPRWLEEPLKWAVLTQAMAKPGAQASSLGQYKTRRESGGPEDNPLLTYARYCQKQYDRLMAERPPQDRTGWESD